MTIVYGILNKHRQPMDANWITAMASKARLPKCKEPLIWQDDFVSLGVSKRVETPEDHYCKQPLSDPEAGTVLLATGRLDYREDLLAKLGLSKSSAWRIPDSVLMELAWRKWNTACSNHLEGDWTLVVWEVKNRQLHLIRDRCGISALHYYDGPEWFAFSTRIDVLLTLPFIPGTFNLARLAEVLVVCPGDGIQTPYSHVHRLPPAHQLTACASSTTVWQYVNPFEERSQSSDADDNDCFEEFVEVFERAVATRMRSSGSTSLTLSGGFDSSCVAAAAHKFAECGGAALKAYTAVPQDAKCEISGRLTDESSIIRRTCQQLRNIIPHFSSSSGTTPIMGMLQTLAAAGEPTHSAGNHYWIVDILRLAEKEGASALLTGQAGNATVSWSGKDIRCGNLLVRCKFQSALTRWKIQCQAKGVLKAFKSEVVSPSVGLLRSRILPRFEAQKRLSTSFLSGDFEDLPNLRSRLHQQCRTSFDNPRQQMLKTTCQQTNPLWCALGDFFGLSIRDPTADERLCRLLLSMPDKQFHSGGENRKISRRYLSDKLLYSVLDTGPKGLQAGDLVTRLMADAATVTLLITRYHQQDTSSLVDWQSVLAAWNKIASSHRKNTVQAHLDALGLMRVLGIGAFMVPEIPEMQIPSLLKQLA